MQVSREKLYEEVWAEPMTTVAKRYEVSGSFLARICERLNVPRPDRGYWAKLAVGKAPQRPRLPVAAPGAEATWSRSDEPKKVARTLLSHVASDLESIGEISVPERLTDPHPVVAKALEQLRDLKPLDDGFLPWSKHRGLKIQTTPGCLSRAARLMDALFRAAEKRGHRISLKTGEEGGACIVVGDQPVGITIIEDLDQVLHVPTKEELAQVKRYSWHKIPKFDKKPSGRLAFLIDQTDRCRGRFGEGERTKQEDKLPKVLLGIEVAAAGLKARRLEWEAREREWEEARKRREEAARLEAEEKARVEQLANQIYRRRLAQEIRDLVCQLRAVTPDDPEQLAKDPGFDKYLVWANEYAEKIDPVSRTRSQFKTGALATLPPLPNPSR